MHEMDMTMTDLDDKTQSNPPPFKIKFWDVFGGVYLSACIIVLAIAVHNRNYKTHHFEQYLNLLFYYISFLNISYKFAIIIINLIFGVFMYYLIFRYCKYIKIYNPELHYKMNYDQDFMQKNFVKRRKYLFIMMIIIPLIVRFI